VSTGCRPTVCRAGQSGSERNHSSTASIETLLSSKTRRWGDRLVGQSTPNSDERIQLQWTASLWRQGKAQIKRMSWPAVANRTSSSCTLTAAEKLWKRADICRASKQWTGKSVTVSDLILSNPKSGRVSFHGDWKRR
jgi:hypothetical protein